MRKKDWIALGLIFAVLIVVFFDLFTLQQAFLSGDHREQQYPWAKFYQEQIRQLSLPWWTTHLGCGFPLLAEGQIGAFYPLNFLFFAALPAKVAYNYGILFHYLLGGFLFYAYLRRLRLSPEASFFSTLIYLFGSTQGGYFYYNYISQKVVIWLPLTLILADLLRERGRLRDAFFLGVVFAVQIFGGYLQVAVYSVFYTVCYLAYWWFVKRSGRFLALCLFAAVLGIALSMAQLLPTYELAKLSSRANAAKEIAYLGSMNPLGLATLFYPAWDGFLRSELYIGLAGLLCFLVSFLHPRHPHKRFFVLAFFLFLLLALGRFSPLYVALVEGTGFASFRTPIKFLFFVSFSGAVLAAFGFDHLFKNLENPAKQLLRVRNLFLACAAFMVWVPVAVPEVLWRLRPQLLAWLQQYARTHLFGRPGHPFPLEVYMQKAVNYYDGVCRTMGLADKQTLVEWALLIFAVFFCVWLFQAPRPVRVRKAAVFLFLFADLFLYGFTSIKANYEPFASIDDPKKTPPIVAELRDDPGIFRVMEVYDQPDQNRTFPLFPSGNMIYGIDDIGIYSPLAIRAYKDFTAGWGYSNDSLALSMVDKKVLLKRGKELDFLNVKYLLSAEALNNPSWRLLKKDQGVFLYRNLDYLSRVFFLPGETAAGDLAGIDPGKALAVPVRTFSQQSVILDYDAPGRGLLVSSDLAYPNWTVRIDGKPGIIKKVNGLFRSVVLEKGNHHVEFRYEPEVYKRWGIVAGMIAGAGFLLILLARVREKSGRKK